jgi:hypothetical protein
MSCRALCACRPEAHWIHLDALYDLFPYRVRAFSTDRPLLLAKQVHSLVLCFLFGVPSSAPPENPFRDSLPYLGFVPLRDIDRSRPLNTGMSSSRYVPPTGFHSLSTVCSVTGRCGLVSSRSHVQGFTVQGFLPTHSQTDSSPTCAPMVLASSRSRTIRR